MEVSDQEAARLVALGVAAYAYSEPKEAHETAPGGPIQAGEGSGAGKHSPELGVVLNEPENGENEGAAELQEGEAEAPDTLDIVDGHFTTESLMDLTRTDMEKLAADMGVDVSKCRNKSDIAALLSAVEVNAEDGGEAPPELGAEAPVV